MHNTTHIHGQTTTWHLTLENRLDQLLLCTLGVFGLQTHDIDSFFLKKLCGIAFIIFNREYQIRGFENLLEHACTFNDRLGVFKHQPVIRGQYRFAFTTVYDQRVDGLVLGWGQFHIGRKRRASETYNTRILDRCDKVLFGLLVNILLILQVWYPFLRVIRFNDATQ